jgi:omega-6 fatty acid desaturase (delta-12 desaturase)
MNRKLRRSVVGTDLSLVLIIATLCWLVGWRQFLLVQAPSLLLTGAVGIWLFYVQHQFEHAYWETNDGWSFDAAAIEGSSHLDLPRILHFFTGNIGFHHIHHLSVRIPNYNLQAAHQAGALEPVTTLSLRDAIQAVRLKLWDQDEQRLVSFRDAKQAGSHGRAVLVRGIDG